MKKLIFTLCALFSACFVNAEDDILSIVPFTTSSNVTVTYDEEDEEFTSGNSFDVNLIYSNDYIACEFKLYVPSGMFAFVEESVQPGDILPVKKSGAPYHETTIGAKASDIEGYDCYLVMAYHNAASPRTFTNDDSGKSLFKIYYGTKGIAEGVYPIYVKDVVLTISQSSYVSVEGVSTSYVKVGSPTDATLAVTGLVPSFVTSALNAETAITTLDLTQATAINGEFALLDSRSLKLPEKDITVEKGTYSRKAPQGFSTLCLPFAYTCSNENFTISPFGGLKNGKTLILSDVKTEVAANTPVIFEAKSVGDLTLSTSKSFNLNGSTSLAVAKDGVSLVGTYAKIAAPEGSYVLQSQKNVEGFYKVVGSTVPSVPANRCYLAGSAAGVKAIAFPDGATAIEALEADASNGDIYDIAGRRVSKADKGIYIVDGKKVIK